MNILFGAINQVPENQKSALIMAKLDKIPQKEITDIMDLSIKAVESILTRAKTNLRKHLKAKGILILKK